jgi:hypothetical protein
VKFGNVPLGSICPAPLPARSRHLAEPDLAGVEIERTSTVARLHVFQVFLEVVREQVAVGVDDERGDRAGANSPATMPGEPGDS